MSTSNVLDLLLKSLDGLEDSINNAVARLGVSSTHREYSARLTGYYDIIKRQRVLAEELALAVSKEDWQSVARYVSLINGLSAMIRDDAKEIIEDLSNK